MTVIQLPQKRKDDDLIFVCNCGCTSFQVIGDGSLACANCENTMERDLPGRWYDSGDVIVDKKEDHFSSFGGNDHEFSERLAKKNAGAPDVTWIIHGNDEGRVTSWGRNFYDTPERVKWIKDQVQTGLDLALGEAKTWA
jgi:hypothetical protein